MDTDKFCNQCGWKVIKENKCSECGAALQDDAKFCPKCGCPADGGHASGTGKKQAAAETTEIPIADIEQNILFETEKEIHKSEKNAGVERHADDERSGGAKRSESAGRHVDDERGDKTRRSESAGRYANDERDDRVRRNVGSGKRTEDERSEGTRRSGNAGRSAGEARGDKARRSGSAGKYAEDERDDRTRRSANAGKRADSEKSANSAMSRNAGKKKRAVPEREWETDRPRKSVPAPETRRKERLEPVRKKHYDEWDDDDDDDDEEDDDNDSIMTIVSVAAAFLILALAAFLIFTMVRKQAPKDYGENTQEETENNDEGEQGAEDGQGTDNDGTTIEDGSGQEPEPEEKNEASAVGTITIVSNVNVRDNPSTEGTNVIKVAKEGETYEYFGTAEGDNWYIIHLEDGSTGYIFKKYVTVN